MKIEELIKKQQDKISSLNLLLESDKCWYNRDLGESGRERLRLKIRMREEFVGELKELEK